MMTLLLACFLTGNHVFAAEALPEKVETFIENGNYYIVKTYIIEGQQKEEVAGKSFEQNGILYHILEVEKKPIETIEKKTVEQIQKVAVSSKDVSQALSKVDSEQYYTDEEGYTGKLFVDAQNISFQINGYRTKSHTKESIQYYYQLSSKDMAYIPKSIVADGVTVQLKNVEWVNVNRSESSDTAVGSNYTAKAYYTGTYMEKVPAGYIATVAYKGEAEKNVINQTEYKVIYEGKKIPLPEIEEKSSVKTGIKIAGVLCISSLLLIGIYCIMQVYQRRKEE